LLLAAAVLLIAPLAARPLAAQQGVWVGPQAPLDSSRAALRDAVIRLRDSVSSVGAAAAALQRDFQRTSAQSLVSRARALRDACSGAVATAPGTREVIAHTPMPDNTARSRQAAAIAQLDSLTQVLQACMRDFEELSRPGQGERVRNYANERADRIQPAAGRYHVAIKGLLDALQIEIRPRGAPANPLAG
jgi:hypothetical protein